MKKFLSIILAVVTMFSIGTMAFAYENVDNTFDNFTPSPGIQAPDNWYDPYSYDKEGLILPYSLVYECDTALYCKKTNKMFQTNAVAVASNGKKYSPYETTIEGHNGPFSVFYCPYCGEHPSLENEHFFDNHMYLQGVVYGAYCNSCGGFTGFPNCYRDNFYTAFYNCYHCSENISFQTDKLYRFVCEKDLNSEAAHLYSDSAHLYGDGKDGKIEDLERDGVTRIMGWNNPDEEPTELTFWEKIVQFFVSIGEFFVKLFTWSW